MKKRILQKKTCFAAGLAGAVAGLACGVLQAAGTGPAEFLWRLAFVLYGLMLLFLAGTERGVQNKTRCVWLLLLFLALLVSYFNLPLLCPALEAVVLPLLGRMYWLENGKSRTPWWVLVVCEAVYLVVRTVMIMPSYEAVAALWVGVALALVSAARGWLLWVLYHNAAAQPDAVADAPAEKLKPYQNVPLTTPSRKD